MLINQIQKLQWKEDLKNYQTQKNQRKLTYSVPFKKTHKLIKNQEYNFNVILNKRRDEKESEPQKSEKPKKKIAQKVNIINMQNPKCQQKNPSSQKKMFQHKTPFNIITNDIKIQNDPCLRQKKKRINEKVFRDYNIINNRFWKDHKEKTIKILETEKRIKEQQLNKNKVFNLINCEFYDSKKEKNFLQKQQQKENDFRKKIAEKIPVSYKMRDKFELGGVKEQFCEEQQIFKEKQLRPLRRYRFRKQIQQKCELQNQNDFQHEEDKLKKYNINKYIDDYKTGYDNIKVQKKTDLNEKIKFAKCNKNQMKGIWDQLNQNNQQKKQIKINFFII